jgi:hypothetical protein
MAKSQDLESANQPRAFHRLIQQMSLTADIDSTENSGSTETTVEKIVTAETEAEMWDADELGLIGGRDIVDVEMRVESYLIRFSSSRTAPDGSEIQSAFVDGAGRGMYLLITSTKLENGEEFTWNTSAPSIVSKLIWLNENNKLPVECVIRGKDLGAGKTYLTLKPVPKRAIK